MSWLRTPLLHFLAGGALLFCGWRTLGAHLASAAPAPPVVIAAADIARLRAAYTTETGLQPTTDDEVALIDRALDEELLFREAVARRLDRGDASIRSWLVEQMRVLTDDASVDEPTLYAHALALQLDRKDLVVRRIMVQKMRLLAARSGERSGDDDTLTAYYDIHAAEYAQAARLSLWHVYLSGARATAAADAAALAAQLRRDGAPGRAPLGGDAFPLPAYLQGQSRQQLEKVIGREVAAAAFAAAPQRWIGPLRSPLGLHVLWVSRRDDAATPPLAAVRGRVLEAWQQEQRAQRIAALLRALRERAEVRVESRPWQERRNA